MMTSKSSGGSSADRAMALLAAASNPQATQAAIQSIQAERDDADKIIAQARADFQDAVAAKATAEKAQADAAIASSKAAADLESAAQAAEQADVARLALAAERSALEQARVDADKAHAAAQARIADAARAEADAESHSNALLQDAANKAFQIKNEAAQMHLEAQAALRHAKSVAQEADQREASVAARESALRQVAAQFAIDLAA